MNYAPRAILKTILVLTTLMHFQIGLPANMYAYDEPEIAKPESLVYKVIDTIHLVMELSYPEHMMEGEQYPAIIFFFGGGWNGGSTDQFKPHAEFFARRGMIGIVADYRVKSRHGTTPFEAVKDAKSAIRFLREHATELQIDPDRIVASGGSAGGHLAAATGIVPGLEEEHENLRVRSKPNALVLFNPVFDNGPDGYGYDRIGDRYPEISPLHNITAGAPPSVVFLGTNDRLIPVSTAENFKRKMEEAGNRCDLFLYEGQQHGFFNYQHPEHYRKTLLEAARFLESLGYIRNLVIYDLNRILVAKDLADQGTEPFASEVRKLREKADALLDMQPVSVMDKEAIPPSGDKHDYYSMGPYWWPDPEKKDGLPYIRRDGIRNPERSAYDAPVLDMMSETVFTLTL
ncbi:MAG: alpha/beta hydrolase fold domain-containing protein, partial [Bacteroidales bacterium]|nr:alpha/beta hydrolase fold domain-containing protein [Bacteroidales bacterium]